MGAPVLQGLRNEKSKQRWKYTLSRTLVFPKPNQRTQISKSLAIAFNLTWWSANSMSKAGRKARRQRAREASVAKSGKKDIIGFAGILVAIAALLIRWPLPTAATIAIVSVGLLIAATFSLHHHLKAWTSVRIAKAIRIAAVFAILAGCAIFEWKEFNKEDVNLGSLISANDPMPPLPPAANLGQIPTNAVLVYFGDSLSWCASFPWKIISFHHEPILTVSTNSEGLLFSGRFFDRDGKIVAAIESNTFTLNPLNYFRKPYRPDRSTLRVIDQTDVVRLDIRFLNRRAIRLLGRIRLPDGREIGIEDHRILMPGLGSVERNVYGTLGDTSIDIEN